MMLYQEKHITTVDKLFKYLRYLREKDYVFRGHSFKTYKLETTLQRFLKTKQTVYSDLELYKTMCKNFEHELATSTYKIKCEDDYEWLQFARHHGIPSPCHDFSLSPYMSLYFAISGAAYSDQDKYISIYAIHPDHLQCYIDNLLGEDQIKIFNEDFKLKENTFFYIENPAPFNTRMVQQLGVLFYDTLDYSKWNCKNLEDLVQNLHMLIPNSKIHKRDYVFPSDLLIAYKINFPKEMLSQIYKELKMMDINGKTLFGTIDMIAADVINSARIGI